MTLTDEQIRAFNAMGNSDPSFRKGELASGNIQLGDTLEEIEGDIATLETTVAVLGSGNAVTWRPGEPSPSGMLFSSWADAYAALQAIDGEKTLYLDGSLSACQPDVGTWDMAHTQIVGTVPVAGTQLTLPEAVVFTGARKFENIFIFVSATSTPPIGDLGALAANDSIVLNGPSTAVLCTSGAPFVRVSGSPTTAGIRLNRSYILAGAPAIDLASYSGIFIIEGQLYGFVANNQIINGAGSTLRITSLTSTDRFSTVQTGYLGTIDTDFIAAYFSPRLHVAALHSSGTRAAKMGHVVPCDPSGGPVTVQLQSAKEGPAVGDADGYAMAGRCIIVKNQSASANAINITPSGGDTIDGGASASITTARGYAMFVSDGVSDWMRVS